MQIDLNELVTITKKLKLLYVEDDEAREATYKLLTNFFNDITIAVDGQEALDKISENSYDLILSDISMPNVNGLQMLEIIRNDNNQTPVIFLSAYDNSEYFTKAIKLGVEYFILKPINLEQFTNAISKVIDKIKLKKENEHYKHFLEEEVHNKTKELNYKLHFDSNIKILNRYSFFEDIKEIKSPLLFLIDINRFKMINEVYGMNTGSLVLNEFANFLTQLYENTSSKVYRISGNEFAVLSSSDTISENSYKNIMEELFASLNDFHVDIINDTISIEISVGISKELTNTYESAELALAYVKSNRLKYIVYSKDIDNRDESTNLIKVKNTIRLALEHHNVLALYQPIVNKAKETVKHEVLMRIKDEDSEKLISPFFFLDVAHKTSLYHSLSSIIILNALDLLKSSRQALSINFTYSDIKNITLIDKINDFFQKNQKCGQKAIFEITEDESIKNYDDVKHFIHHFKKYGVRIAIDDFGTGFSNFEHILELEPNYLKIDGTLIKNIDKDNRSYTLVQAIVTFSHKLGIKLIAEFVHSEEIFNMLNKLDIDEYQGYYFAEPLSQLKS